MKSMTGILFTCLIALTAELCGSETSSDWQFTDIDGKLHEPFSDSSARGIVLVFVSTNCPIANSYQPLLRRLDEQYADQGIRFFQVHPHAKTTEAKARAHATEFEIRSPIVVDANQELSRRVGAKVTPEVFVYPRGDALPVYRGRIDNLYAGYGKKRRVATSNDLSDVLDRLVAGLPLERTETKSTGCIISYASTKAVEPRDSEPAKIGFEILHVKSPNEIQAWASKDITQQQFNELKLPPSWFKNQPREVNVDQAKFLNSPGREHGSFSTAEHFGHSWVHVATIKKIGFSLDPKRRLIASRVIKDHVVTFEKGTTIMLLVSPQGEVFPRITRDANRKRDVPTVPEDWRLIPHTLDQHAEFRLTGETTVVRTDNQDSFQGPVEFSLDSLAR